MTHGARESMIESSAGRTSHPARDREDKTMTTTAQNITTDRDLAYAVGTAANAWGDTDYWTDETGADTHITVGPVARDRPHRHHHHTHIRRKVHHGTPSHRIRIMQDHRRGSIHQPERYQDSLPRQGIRKRRERIPGNPG